MQTITVPLGERSYPIHIERGLLAKTGEMIREKLGDIAVAVVSDDHVAPLYVEEVVSSMEKAFSIDDTTSSTYSGATWSSLTTATAMSPSFSRIISPVFASRPRSI